MVAVVVVVVAVAEAATAVVVGHFGSKFLLLNSMVRENVSEN